MHGFITDSELTQADQEFPGIARFFGELAAKPRTFLELVALYDGWVRQSGGTEAAAPAVEHDVVDDMNADQKQPR